MTEHADILVGFIFANHVNGQAETIEIKLWLLHKLGWKVRNRI
jgi:hypothetical protein